MQCWESALVGQQSITGASPLLPSISAGVNRHAQGKAPMDLCPLAPDQRVAPWILGHFRVLFF